jgi:hypothetical protein
MLGDVRPNPHIFGVKRQPFFERRLCIGLDSFCGTFRHAYAAIYAFVGVNDEHVLAFIEAIDRANFDAVHVFALDAILDDDVGHVPPLVFELGV